ncbi:MAG: DUF4403 family protein [Saprospiraceae bacterium]
MEIDDIEKLDPIELDLKCSIHADKKVLYAVFEELLNAHASYFNIPLKSFVGSFRIEVRKVASAEYQLNSNSLELNLPYSIDIFKGKSRKPIIQASFRIRNMISINLDNVWTPDLAFNYLGIDWLDRPTLRVLGIKFGIEGILERQLRKRMPGILNDVENKIKQQMAVRNLPQLLLDSLRKPLSLPPQFPMKVYASPDSLTIFPLIMHGNRISSGVHIIGGLDIESNLPDLQDLKMPSLQYSVRNSEIVEGLEACIRLPYLHWIRIANYLLDADFLPISQGKERITKIYSIEAEMGLVHIEAEMEGIVSGRVRFGGTPIFNEAQQMIWLRSPDFHILDGNIFKRVLSGMLSNMLSGKIEDKFLVRLKEHLHTAEAEIKKNLAAADLPGPAILNWKDSELRIQELTFEQDLISIKLCLFGQFELIKEKMS